MKREYYGSTVLVYMYKKYNHLSSQAPNQEGMTLKNVNAQWPRLARKMTNYHITRATKIRISKQELRIGIQKSIATTPNDHKFRPGLIFPTSVTSDFRQGLWSLRGTWDNL